MATPPPTLAPEEPGSCATCGAALDRLRAPWVALYDDALCAYCSRACWEKRSPPGHPKGSFYAPTPYTPSPAASPPPSSESAQGPLLALAHQLGLHSPSLPPELRPTEAPSLVSLVPETPDPASTPRPLLRSAAVVLPADKSLLLPLLCALCTLLVLGLARAPISPVLALLLALLLALFPLVLASRALRWLLRAGASPVLLAPPLLSIAALGLLAMAESGPARLERIAVTLASATLLVGTATHVRRRWLVVRAGLREFRKALEATVARQGPGGLEDVEASTLHVGDALVVEEGETLAVDAEVLEGRAVLEVRVAGRAARSVTAGDTLLAGMRLRTGRLTVRVLQRPGDSALARLVRLGPGEVLASAGQLRTERGARQLAAAGVGLALLAALMHAQGGGSNPLAVAALALGMMPASLVATLSPTLWLRAAARGLARGVLFGDAAAMQTASVARTVVLCMRGTVTRGSFELTDVVSLGARSEAELLGWAAGLEEHAAGHPVALAIARAAKTRGVEPRGVRRPAVHPGMGLVATGPDGAAVVLGSRALLLSEGVSVADAEEVANALEAQGRGALFLALAGRVEGVLGLVDALRPEARPAVQALLDEGLEVVLLGGESRGTVEALGQQLDVASTRPELAPGERAQVVKRLAEVAGPVAVVGRAGLDALALAAADVAVVLDGGSVPAPSVHVLDDELRAASESLVLARELRRELARLRVVLLVAGVAATLLVGFVPSLGAPGLLALGALLHGAAVLVTRERR